MPVQPLTCRMQVGYNYFRLHPKGVGLICKQQGGIPPLTFVEEYLGEIHTPWRWFEIQARGTGSSWAFAQSMHVSAGDVPAMPILARSCLSRLALPNCLALPTTGCCEEDHWRRAA